MADRLNLILKPMPILINVQDECIISPDYVAGVIS